MGLPTLRLSPVLDSGNSAMTSNLPERIVVIRGSSETIRSLTPGSVGPRLRRRTVAMLCHLQRVYVRSDRWVVYRSGDGVGICLRSRAAWLLLRVGFGGIFCGSMSLSQFRKYPFGDLFTRPSSPAAVRLIHFCCDFIRVCWRWASLKTTLMFFSPVKGVKFSSVSVYRFDERIYFPVILTFTRSLAKSLTWQTIFATSRSGLD